MIHLLVIFANTYHIPDYRGSTRTAVYYCTIPRHLRPSICPRNCDRHIHVYRKGLSKDSHNFHVHYILHLHTSLRTSSLRTYLKIRIFELSLLLLNNSYDYTEGNLLLQQLVILYQNTFLTPVSIIANSTCTILISIGPQAAGASIFTIQGAIWKIMSICHTVFTSTKLH